MGINGGSANGGSVEGEPNAGSIAGKSSNSSQMQRISIDEMEGFVNEKAYVAKSKGTLDVLFKTLKIEKVGQDKKPE